MKQDRGGAEGAEQLGVPSQVAFFSALPRVLRPSAVGFFLLACRAPVAPPERFPAGHEIVVCGERVLVDAPVVLWSAEPFYDAYLERPRFAESGREEKRYRPGREPRTSELAARVEREGWTRANLAEQVELFVIHYDACGTSRSCFRVLQDERVLSVHFLLDLDGTLYQTLDLKEQAWHARAANPRSIGIEIAHVGAYSEFRGSPLERWYGWTEEGLELRIPRANGDGGLRTALAAHARYALVRGPVHGREFVQPEFTAAQYRSLSALAAALARVFPRLELHAPRAAEGGGVRAEALSTEEAAAFRGVLGHFHLQTDKLDPGPAFDWEGFLRAARGLELQP
jgi:N-acetyl-anhydromuramyl-L-alanine amidase AmpD